VTEITTTRGNALIDPVLHVWHAEIPIYLFLGGVVAGLLVLPALDAWRRPDAPRSRALALLPWLAPVLLSLGMLFLWLDLENRWNVLRFYFVLRAASPMSWGAWILLLIYPRQCFALAQLLEGCGAGRPALAQAPAVLAFARGTPPPFALLSAASVWRSAFTRRAAGRAGARLLWNSAVSARSWCRLPRAPLHAALPSGGRRAAAAQSDRHAADRGRARAHRAVAARARDRLGREPRSSRTAAGRALYGRVLDHGRGGGSAGAAVPNGWHRHASCRAGAALLVLVGGRPRADHVAAGQHAGWTSLIALP
jgi:hypothetical protein